jgi:hypothetical protein
MFAKGCCVGIPIFLSVGVDGLIGIRKFSAWEGKPSVLAMWLCFGFVEDLWAKCEDSKLLVMLLVSLLREFAFMGVSPLGLPFQEVRGVNAWIPMVEYPRFECTR